MASSLFSRPPDGRILCVLQISDLCPGYVKPEDVYVEQDGTKVDACQPCGRLEWSRYVTEHYG